MFSWKFALKSEIIAYKVLTGFCALSSLATFSSSGRRQIKSGGLLIELWWMKCS